MPADDADDKSCSVKINKKSDRAENVCKKRELKINYADYFDKYIRIASFFSRKGKYTESINSLLC